MVTQMYSRIEMVSPETAGDWLRYNKENRPISSTWVRRYANEIKSGRWGINNDAIAFDEHGNLLNGQHRLLAIIEANTPVRCLILRGIPAEAFLTMDIGKRRTFADYLTMDGQANSAMLQSALAWLYKFEHETTSTLVRPSYIEMKALLEAHPDIVDSVQAMSTWKIPGAPSLYAALHYLFARAAGEEAADEFWERVNSGVGLEAGDPRLKLRERLHVLARSATKPRTSELAGMAIRAWNAWRAGRNMRSIPLMTRTIMDERGVRTAPLPKIAGAK